MRLLCVVAHPDDECYAFGGVLALAAERGIETSVVCLTDGQAATHRGEAASNAELGSIRRAEFAASCGILGVSHFELLDYQDAQLEFANFNVLAGTLVARMRSLRPHVVVTFGMDGGLNTHVDHTVVSAATTAAFHWAGSPKRFADGAKPYQPQRLYHATTSYFLPARRAPLPAPWSVILDVSNVLDKKKLAFAAHASQRPLMEQTEPIFAEHGNEERYALIAAIDPQPSSVSTDLFAGLVPD